MKTQYWIKKMVSIIMCLCCFMTTPCFLYAAQIGEAEWPSKEIVFEGVTYSRDEIVEALALLDVTVSEDMEVYIVSEEKNVKKTNAFQIIEPQGDVVAVTTVLPFADGEKEAKYINATDMIMSVSTQSGYRSYHNVSGTAYYYRNIDNTGRYTYKPFKIQGLASKSTVTYFKVEHSAAGGGDSYYNSVTKSNPAVAQTYAVTYTHPNYMDLANGMGQYHTMKITVRDSGTSYNNTYSLPPCNGYV